MKIFTAAAGETLRTIAKKHRVAVEKLVSLNPHLSSTNRNIGGQKVKLPSSSQNTSKRPVPSLPPCAPQIPEQFQDHFIPLTSLDEMAETDYDVLVVGTGAGGGAAVWRLCEQLKNTNKKIGVVEAGPILLQTHAANLPTLAGKFNNYFLNPKISTPIGKFLPDLPGAREVIALGGLTLFWGRACPRMHMSEWSNYPIEKRELDLYYNIAEQMMTVQKPFYPLSYSFLTRLWQGGFPEASVIPRATNVEPAKFGPVVNFSSISFLGSALLHRSFDLAVNARAVQILNDGKKVTGIKVMTPDKKAYELTAKNVILSANAYETPRLLLASGIKGEAIGHYLTLHSFLRSSFEIQQPTNGGGSSLGLIDLSIPQTDSEPSQIQIEISERYKTIEQGTERHVETYSFGRVEGRYENKLFLDPNKKDEYGVPEIQVDFSFSPKDLSILNSLTKRFIKAARILGAEKPPELCLSAPGSDYHTMGTCRMGDDPLTSSTNRYGQIHSILGLYAADNSILPNTGAANPTLTTVALAIRTADYITRNLDS
ncbi:GMC oxidoreductase [Bacillus taeanensis]|uniref:GMC family oxidoreductase n=1 Tax=Bacillus taeanensis TaxID=273032 RepID=A0A366XUW9_9BACI|nr:GMC oxidoreductase [Bacillus taeanensis]RBW67933.1 GMC family oxidoreductase [Bacillus taeanensis]